jgi:hypothetical protein
VSDTSDWEQGHFMDNNTLKLGEEIIGAIVLCFIFWCALKD